MPTVTVIVEVPDPGAASVAGLKLTVVPLGMPEAVKLTELLKPPPIVTVIVEIPWVSCITLSELGEAERVKLGAPVTVSVTLVLCWTPPPLPVTVIE